ncbi:MAG: ribonuclease P protein component [Patescibacteria group bacterium]
MLPKRKRLSRAAFKTLGPSKRLTSEHFSVSVHDTGSGRASAVVSKKVAKRSVDRHLLKRRMLAVITKHLLPHHSYVVYAKLGSERLPYNSLSKELSELLTKLRRV